jgi:DNA-binding MarR family transcriptional regulator
MSSRRAAGATDPVADPIAEAERALEGLFRMSAGRRTHTRQAAQVGAVVTRAGYAVLRSLADGGELTLSDIGRLCVMDPAATGRQVRQLEQEGLVERTTLEADGRVTVVRLTEHGRRVYERVVAMRVAYMRAVLDGWSDVDRRRLAGLVDRLVEDMRHLPFGDPTPG